MGQMYVGLAVTPHNRAEKGGPLIDETELQIVILKIENKIKSMNMRH